MTEWKGWREKDCPWVIPTDARDGDQGKQELGGRLEKPKTVGRESKWELDSLREKGRERNIDVIEKHWPALPILAQTGDQTHNTGTCPNCQPNPQPLGYRRTLQPTEPLWPGSKAYLFFLPCVWQGYYLKPEAKNAGHLHLLIKEPIYSCLINAVHNTMDSLLEIGEMRHKGVYGLFTCFVF